MAGSRHYNQSYIQSRANQAIALNNTLAQILNNLNGILEQALRTHYIVKFEDMKKHEEFPDFQLPSGFQSEPVKPSQDILKVEKPDFIDELLGEVRYKRAVWTARNKYSIALKEYDRKVDERNQKILELRNQHEKKKKDFEISQQQHNKMVVELEIGYKNGIPDAIKAYCTIILNSSRYPQDFPHKFRLAYILESKELVIEYEMPNKGVIPDVSEFRFLKTKGTIEKKLRKPSEIKEIYQNIVAAICLRTIYEVFKTDQGNYLDVVVFNGLVNDIDPATGKDIHPCLISVRTTKESFREINLSRVDKKACLRNLGGQVSPQPSELQPVKPVVEFDMVDKRFVKDQDVLSDLESRPNLMDLNPWEFENLVNNLFSKMGLDAKLTRSSKDGGVDVVAFDVRPILGGKVVIQAKRYKNVVGVSAVRDLYGTMINEGANKGILVTTSHYGPDAYDFSKDKPIELIDGGGLLYLLEQNGVKARIVFPEEEAHQQ